MKIRWSALTLVMPFLLAGCSPGPGSTPPAAGETGAVVANRPETPAATQTAPPPDAASSAPATGPGESSPPPAEQAQVPSLPAPTQVSGSPEKPAPADSAAPSPKVAESTPAPRPEAAKPVPADFPAPPPSQAPIAVDVGGVVEVAATKPGLTRIGSVKCKLCHKVQFDSWAKTAHAARTPPLDCESCHGPGSEYKSLAIMKDSGKAKAAGLVMPSSSFCSKCHTSGGIDDLLKRTHAHKAGA